MAEFDFDYHDPTTEYPETGTRLSLGGSYSFASSPTSPPQRLVTLRFQEMRNYWDRGANSPDVVTNPKINFYRLEAFYKEHELWKTFDYRHPQYGLMKCRFNKPLKTPGKVQGMAGVVEGFTVELIEQP